MTDERKPARGGETPGLARRALALYRGENFARAVKAYVPLAALSPIYMLLLRLAEGVLSTFFPEAVSIDAATYTGILLGVSILGNLLHYIPTSVAAWRVVSCLGGVPVPIRPAAPGGWRRCLRALFGYTLLQLVMLLAGNLTQNGLGMVADELVWNVGIQSQAFGLGATLVITTLGASVRALIAALFALWLPYMALGGMRFFPALGASLRGTKGRLGGLLLVFIPFYVVTGPLFDMLLSFLDANVFSATQVLDIPRLLTQGVLYTVELFAAPILYAAAVLVYPGKIAATEGPKA